MNYITGPLCVLQIDVDAHYCTSFLTSYVHVNNDLNQKFQVWIHHSIRPANIWSSSCAIWHTDTIFSLLPFRKTFRFCLSAVESILCPTLLLLSSTGLISKETF